jgi:hypothetical protein
MPWRKKKGVGKQLDRLVMGAIIGGAIFSVIGARRRKKREASVEAQEVEALREEHGSQIEVAAPRSRRKKKKRSFLKRLFLGK